MSGYVRAYRSLFGHHAFRNDAEGLAFLWMVAHASWKPARVRYKDRDIVLQRGQLAISVRDFAGRIDRDKAWVTRLLHRLKTKTMIKTASETGVTLITICNYDKFQALAENGETLNGTAPKTANETGVRQERDTEQRREEGKKVSSSELTKYPPPFGVDASVWSDYLKMRKVLKKPMSATAYKRQLSKLSELTAAGHPPGEVVAQSVERGWAGFFEVKGAANGNSTDSLTARALQSIGALPH